MFELVDHMRFVIYFCIAAFCQGTASAANLYAQATGQSPATIYELIQFGGTGGLIVALLGAVIMLWRDRKEMRAEWAAEVEAIRKLLGEERAAHRAEVSQLISQHKNDLDTLSERYTDELKKQIAALREETRDTYSRKPPEDQGPAGLNHGT